MIKLEGIPLSRSPEFCLAAAFAVALRSRNERLPALLSSISFTEVLPTTSQIRPSGRSSRGSDLSSDVFSTNWSTLYRSEEVGAVSNDGEAQALAETRNVSSQCYPLLTSAVVNHYTGVEKTENEISDLAGDLNIINEEADRQSGLTCSAPKSRPSSPVRSRNRYGQGARLKVSRSHSNSAANVPSVLSTMSFRSQASMKSKEFWEQMCALQLHSIRTVLDSTFSRSAIAAHALESWKILTKTYSSLRSRPVELQASIQLYAVSATKLLEFLIVRGYGEVSTLMNEFITGVFSSYLRKPKNLCELSQGWVQSREVLRTVCQTPTNIDVLLALMATVAEVKLRFLNKMTCNVIDRDTDFVAYAVEQMSDLENCISHRVQQCRRKKTFGLVF
ncbi:hypothetical protein RB195_001631 [Necator americanus]|uniref:Uncharacterized protein n=1 Tax=Necator americanus TaxID=51031 RepID=A0ABR1DF79_NECAM